MVHSLVSFLASVVSILALVLLWKARRSGSWRTQNDESILGIVISWGVFIGLLIAMFNGVDVTILKLISGLIFIHYLVSRRSSE